MNNPKDDKVDFKWLTKYLAGEATPEEAIEVDDWILHSEDNRRLFEQMAATWEGMNNIPFEATRRTSLYRVSLYRMGIAASLIVLFGAIWLLVRLPRKDVSGNTTPAAISYITKRAGSAILRDTLPDHSMVVQYTNSILQYTSDFNTGNREMHLTGEAWFNVASNPAKPFVLKIGKLRVTVLGTSFNVQQSPSRIEVSVKTGSIMMSTDSDSLIVKAGRKGIYDIKENRFILQNSFNLNEQGYATRVLTFENTALKDIVAQIEKAYGVSVVFRDEHLKDLTMSSSFDNDSITYIFDVISVTLHLKYKIENNIVYISGA